MDSIQRLRILRQIALDGSFSAAARSLGMSQPSVSQQVALLERELGSVLLERSPRGVRLTAGGEVALKHALRILNAADTARREIEALRVGTTPILRVAAFGTACHAIVPSAMSLLRRSHPGIRFDLDERDADDAIERVRLGRADVAVVFDYAAHPLDLHGLQGTLIHNDHVALALREDDPRAAQDPVLVSELVDATWIGGTGFGCVESLRTVCGAAGFEPKIALDSNRYPTTLALVAAGHGIALVPCTALTMTPPQIVVRQLLPPAPARRIWTVTEPSPDPIIAEFCQALADDVADAGTEFEQELDGVRSLSHALERSFRSA